MTSTIKTKTGVLSLWNSSPQHKRKYSDEVVDSMRKRKLNGETWRAIGEDYNMDASSVYQMVQRHNPIIQNEIKIPKDYVTVNEYCDINSYDYNMVLYRIRHRDIPHITKDRKIYLHEDTILENGRYLSEKNIEKIMELFNSGMKRKDIAVKLGICARTVGVYVKLYQDDY